MVAGRQIYPSDENGLKASMPYVRRSFEKLFSMDNFRDCLSKEDALQAPVRPEAFDLCYACMKKEPPSFHSISCEQDHPLFLEANAGSSLYPVQRQLSLKHGQRNCRRWLFGTVRDPRGKFILQLNRWFLLARSVSLAVDPLFFYTLSVSSEGACLYMDGLLAMLVTIFRTVTDSIHLLHIWLQLKMAYISKESLVLGRGILVWDARKVALHYLHPKGGFWSDLFVILPIPQIVLWMVVPHMIKNAHIASVMTVFLITFLFQYIPKLCHGVFLAHRLRRVSGYIFGSVWWGFSLNLTAYLIAGHVAGGCWYLLASQRVALCMIDECDGLSECDRQLLGCSPQILFTGNVMVNQGASQFINQTATACFLGTGNYGIFSWAIPLVTNHEWGTKVFYPIFWGLMTLSSFGNALVPSDHVLELVFSIIVITCGLLLFTLLIGNIQVVLNSLTTRKESMKLRIRDLEWWMRRRQLPLQLRHRVRRHERHLWAATRGIDEMEMVDKLPEGLRRDIKRHLCLNLVCQVPLFEHLDSLVLENICDRLKPYLFIKGETVIRQGDPVQRMFFIARGHLRSSHELTDGKTSMCYLGPGNFCGDELLTWCLQKPFVDRLPACSATLTSVDSTEAFGLDSYDLKFVTEHFRYKFINEKMKRTARYYSSGWRTWAVVTIQLAWRRYKAKKAKMSIDKRSQVYPLGMVGSMISCLSSSESEQDRLRFYAAMFSSHKPQDHLE